MGICAVILAYSPNMELLREDVSRFIDHVDKLLIWRDSPMDEAALTAGHPKWAAKVESCGEGIKRRVAKPVFILFSDDMDWVRENVRIDAECHYESGADPVWEKLRLMYSCRHFIIPNSTFAWWAQWLSRSEDKVVVSPERWFNDDRPQFLIQDDFIKIRP